MKTLKILFALCFMLGCAVPANSQVMGKQVKKPLKGSFYAWVVEENPITEVMSIIGNATHLGNVKGSKMTLVRPTLPPPLVATFSGILMAANGDYVNFNGYSTMTITAPPASGTMVGEIFITGGTGRFSGCTGEADIIGIFDMEASCTSYSIDGTITY